MSEPKTRAQAVAAAEAVNEARLELTRVGGDESQDRALYHLEMLYWRKADELQGARHRKRAGKLGRRTLCQLPPQPQPSERVEDAGESET